MKTTPPNKSTQPVPCVHHGAFYVSSLWRLRLAELVRPFPKRTAASQLTSLFWVPGVTDRPLPSSRLSLGVRAKAMLAGSLTYNRARAVSPRNSSERRTQWVNILCPLNWLAIQQRLALMSALLDPSSLPRHRPTGSASRLALPGSRLWQRIDREGSGGARGARWSRSRKRHRSQLYRGPASAVSRYSPSRYPSGCHRRGFLRFRLRACPASPSHACSVRPWSAWSAR